MPLIRKILATTTLLAWALWLGGLIALFLLVQTLFAKDRPLAGDAAPILFTAFERYQIILAAIAVLSVVGWRMVSRQGLLRAVFLLLGLATVGAALGPITITSRMQSLRVKGLSGTPEFRKLHGYSMIVYVGGAVLLAGAGVLLPIVIRRDEQANAKVSETARPAA